LGCGLKQVSFLLRVTPNSLSQETLKRGKIAVQHIRPDPSLAMESPLREIKQRAHKLAESQRALQQERSKLEAERNQLLFQLQELSAAAEAHHSHQAALSTQLKEVTTDRDNLQQELASLRSERDHLSAQQQTVETARSTLGQVLDLAHGKQQSKVTGKEGCRNCGSHRLITINRAGQMSSFFAARVFGLKSASTSEFFLDAHLCIDCLFLTHAAKLPEESIARLYKDYRKDSYNRERISFEPIYSLIAEQIGKPDEIRRRVADLDGYIEELTKNEIFAPDNIGSALDWGGSTGDYIPTSIAAACREVHIFDITHNEIDDNDCGKSLIQAIRTSNIAQGKAYDYIQFCHVLEHLQEPLRTIQQIVKFNLREGGYIYIEVPIEEIMNEFAPMLMLDPNAHYTVHEHINKYCLSSIEALIESTACLSILDLREDSTSVGWVLPGVNDDGRIKIIRCLCRHTPDKTGVLSEC
jgi:2-polyprenyl-3-methyl-5-hydroxy-6-metoxy-1,4-benzoquinol methylase